MNSEEYMKKRELEESEVQERLLSELRSLTTRRPPENAPPSVEDEFHLRTHDIYFEILSRYPSFAVERKLELEMWNSLYKAPIDALQAALHRRAANGAGHSRSVMELKLRCGLLLDRASGVYLTLIYRLLQSLHESSWPKSLLGTVSSTACPNGLFLLNRSGRTTGRFDLDLATFNALHQFTKVEFTGLHTWWHRSSLNGEIGADAGIQKTNTTTTAPRILSRGARLPSEYAPKPEEVKVLTDSEQTTEDKVRSVANEGTAPNLPKIEGSFHQETKNSTVPTSTGPRTDYLSAVTYIVQHCLVHLGDVARYRQQSNVAASYYLWAWAVHPDSGHPYNQLAILESTKPATIRRLETLFYYYVRATSCLYPFPVAKTNLRGILRTHIDALHATTKPQSSAPDKQPLKEARHLLLFLYAAIQLGWDPAQLTATVREVGNIIMNGSHLSSGDQWIPRLVIIHIYLLDEWLARVPIILSDPDPAVQKIDLSNKDSLIVLMLFQLMVYLIHWLAKDYNHQKTKLAANEDQTSIHAPLGGLVLWFIWLRKRANMRSASTLNHWFQCYIPALSESMVQLLNSISVDKSLTETMVSETTQEHRPVLNGNLSQDRVAGQVVDNFFVPWTRLIQLPELITLQGFRPLDIPTQYQLGLTQPVKLQCPLRISSARSEKTPELSETSIGICTFSTPIDRAEEHRLRLMCLIQSARLVAHSFPALLGRKEPCPSPLTEPVSEFIVPDATKLDWMELASEPSEQKISHSNLTVISNTTSKKSNSHPGDSVNLREKVEPTSISPASNNTVSNASKMNDSIGNETLKNDGLQLSVPSQPNVVPLPSTSSSLVSVEATHDTVLSPNHTVSDAECMATPTSVTTSGGLIVNAELAKFIQEQASQVAARQQRAGFSTTTSTNDFLGRTKSSGSDSVHKSASTGTFRTLSGKGTSSNRLCLSAAFRRDLPPRFARRLQAELLEREARGKQQAGLDTSQSDVSGSALLSLDQPAPLARKESEAPYDLNSLLSVTDRSGVDRMSVSPPNSRSSGVALGIEASRDLVDTTPNPLQSINTPHYIAPPIHPSLSMPSMFPQTAPVAPFARGVRPLFNTTLNLPSVVRPQTDWHANPHGLDANSFRSDYVPNAVTYGFILSNSGPLDSQTHSFHPVTTLGPPPTRTVIMQEDHGFCHSDILSLQATGISTPPLFLDGSPNHQVSDAHEPSINPMTYPTNVSNSYTDTEQPSSLSYTTVS